MSQFFRRMDAFFEEYPYVTVDDLKEFWDEWKPFIKSWYDNSDNWLRFRELVMDICEEHKELYEDE